MASSSRPRAESDHTDTRTLGSDSAADAVQPRGHDWRNDTTSDSGILDGGPPDRGSAEPGAKQTAPEGLQAKAKRWDLSPTQVIGGALASMTAAALGSRLGVAGTIGGAAMASVCMAVLGSVYTASIRHTKTGVAKVVKQGAAIQQAAMKKGDQRRVQQPGRRSDRQTSQEPSHDAITHPAVTLSESDADAGQMTSSGTPGEENRGNRRSGQNRHRSPRRRLVITTLVSAAAVFAITVGAVAVFEVISGRSLDGDPGRTTVGRVVSGSNSKHSPADSGGSDKSDRNGDSDSDKNQDPGNSTDSKRGNDSNEKRQGQSDREDRNRTDRGGQGSSRDQGSGNDQGSDDDQGSSGNGQRDQNRQRDRSGSNNRQRSGSDNSNSGNANSGNSGDHNSSSDG